MALGEEQLLALWSEGREMLMETALTVASGVGRSRSVNREAQTLTSSQRAIPPANTAVASGSIR